MSTAAFALLGVAAVWLLFRLRTALTLRAILPLEALTSASQAGGTLPSVTVVAAGRNEAAHLEEAVRTWLAQDLHRLDVVYVDDRSDDTSPELLRRLANEDGRLTVLRLGARPEGWLGKCNALHQGLRLATGDYVLFTDADVKLEPGCLSRALAYCERDGVEHLALLPRVETRSIAQEAFTACFFHAFLVSLVGPRPNSDDPRCALGVGAFGLVRRAAVEAVGGFEEIRLQVGDDPALARLLVNAGYRHRVLDGQSWLRLRWQDGLWGTVRGLEKNAFWGARFSLAITLTFTALTLGSLLPLLGPFTSSLAGWAAFSVWCVGTALPYLTDRRRGAHGAVLALLHPLSAMLLVVTVWNSAIRTLARGGIRWRGDLVPLEELRAALKPLRWWRPGPPRDSARRGGPTAPPSPAT